MASPTMPARRSAFVRQAGLTEREPPPPIPSRRLFPADPEPYRPTDVWGGRFTCLGLYLECERWRRMKIVAQVSRNFRRQLIAEIRLQAIRERLTAKLIARGFSPEEVRNELAVYDRPANSR